MSTMPHGKLQLKTDAELEEMLTLLLVRCNMSGRKCPTLRLALERVQAALTGKVCEVRS